MNKLKKIKLKYSSSHIKLENLINFIENHKSVTHLSFSLMIFEDHEYESVLREFSKLDQLVDLKINSQFLSHQSINKSMRQLSANCLKLKSFRAVEYFTDLPLLQSFLTEVKKFKGLERLEFGFCHKNINELNFGKYFNGLQSLTHLTIYIFNSFRMKKDLLKGIDKSLPNLVVFNIKVAERNSIEVSEQTTVALTRLSRLESLEITVNNESIRDLIVSKVMKKCKKLKTIDIKVKKF